MSLLNFLMSNNMKRTDDNKLWTVAKFDQKDLMQDFIYDDIKDVMDCAMWSNKTNEIAAYGKEGTLFVLEFLDRSIKLNVITPPSQDDWKALRDCIMAPNKDADSDIFVKIDMAVPDINDAWAFHNPVYFTHYHTT